MTDSWVLHRCPLCTRSYKRPEHLRRHVVSHTSGRPYKCHLCDCAFHRSDVLKKHLKSCRDASTKATRMQGIETTEETNAPPDACGGFEPNPPLHDLSLPSAPCPGSDIAPDLVNESWTSGQNGDSIFPDFLSDMPWSDALCFDAGYHGFTPESKEALLISASWMISPNTTASSSPLIAVLWPHGARLCRSI